MCNSVVIKFVNEFNALHGIIPFLFFVYRKVVPTGVDVDLSFLILLPTMFTVLKILSVGASISAVDVDDRVDKMLIGTLLFNKWH